ncbi:hypothetical protein [Falsirhodobacter sp. alg1]|uniref:hypothetical protein n=1 Tax=Falsirhodobacter sp. alg1 TaxID=1472418 RepID=UPI00178CA4C2|nr:hypothetical protein [Falsirhodobacter sp. alg1]
MTAYIPDARMDDAGSGKQKSAVRDAVDYGWHEIPDFACRYGPFLGSYASRIV